MRCDQSHPSPFPPCLRVFARADGRLHACSPSDRAARPPPDYVSQGTWTFGALEFSSEFCSGNIAAVEQLDDAGTSFELTTAADCAGMACVTGYRTWFYYVVRGAKKDLNLTMVVSNMNPQTKMFNQGMKPCYKVGDGPSAKWERLPSDISHSVGEGRIFEIKFRFRFSSDAPVYFAFCYPYSFEETVKKCDAYAKLFSPACGYSRARDDSVYFEREVLTTDSRHALAPTHTHTHARAHTHTHTHTRSVIRARAQWQRRC